MSLTTRRRAEQLAAAIDAPAGDATPVAAHVAPLVAVVDGLREAAEHAPATPSADFTLALRERLMAEAATVLAPADATLRLPRHETRHPRRLAAAASALVLVGGGASLAAASASALPGEALYPVKRGVEALQFQLDSGAGAGRDMLSAAATRLDEAGALIENGDPGDEGLVPTTLDDFSGQADTGGDLLLRDYAQTGDEASAAAVREFAADSLAQITYLLTVVPEDQQGPLADAAVTVTRLDRAAAQLCPECGGDVLRLPDSVLARAEVSRVMAGLGGSVLDNSHPVALDADAAAALRETAQKVRDGSASGSGSGSGSGAGAEGGVGDVGGTVDQGTDGTGAGVVGGGTLDDVEGALGDTVEGATGGSSAGGGTGSGSVKDTVDGVTDTTETIVPDPVDQTVDKTVDGAVDGAGGTVDGTVDGTGDLLN